MVEVAEELVEAVHRRQELVAVAEVVLAELAGRIALRLQDVGDGRVLLRQAFRRAGQADLEQAGADRRLAGDEGGAARRAGLLAVIVGEDRAFAGDAVDVGRAVAHHAAIVGADVPQPDVVAHDDQDVGLCRRCLGKRRCAEHEGRHDGRSSPCQFALSHRLPRVIGTGLKAPTALQSKAKMRFQSFFMLITVQPFLVASS